MSLIPRFAEYAAAFEVAYASDDDDAWRRVGEFFHEDAAYETGDSRLFPGRVEGRDAILAYFRRVLDGFDRRFASRAIALVEGPKETDDSVWIRGTATYTSEARPDLVLELEETVTYDGDRIALLRDDYSPQMAKALDAYLDAHGEALGLEPPVD